MSLAALPPRLPPHVAGAAPARPAPSGRSRVMVVDDSAVARGLMARWLTESGDFDVVATAANGQAAIDDLDRAEPDLVLLDLEMPGLDGLATLPRLLAKRPRVAVVVVSTLTRRNADVSLKCLSLGAVDYLPKPEANRAGGASAEFRTELVAKLRALARSRTGRAFGSGSPALVAAPSARPARALPPRTRASRVAPQCLLIGASTGGPKAVAEVLAGLGATANKLPVLIVQHMPPIFTKVFAEHLAAQTGLAVREAEHGEAARAGRVYVAPGGRHMGLVRERAEVAIRLDDGPPVNFCRPAVDVLLQDAARVVGAASLCVVLTGMGSDGTEGARSLVAAGGTVLAQDEATSTVWGMPGSVAKAGLAADVLPLDRIAAAIKGLVP